MRPELGRLAAVVLLATSVSCSRIGRVQRDRPDPQVITAAQLHAGRFANAMNAIESLHSNWLKARGPDSFQKPTQVLVYFDNSRVGGVETLRNFDINIIVYIRFIDGITASTRWGLDHGAGVIYISTHAGSVP